MLACATDIIERLYDPIVNHSSSHTASFACNTFSSYSYNSMPFRNSQSYNQRSAFLDILHLNALLLFFTLTLTLLHRFTANAIWRRIALPVKITTHNGDMIWHAATFRYIFSKYHFFPNPIIPEYPTRYSSLVSLVPKVDRHKERKGIQIWNYSMLYCIQHKVLWLWYLQCRLRNRSMPWFLLYHCNYWKYWCPQRAKELSTTKMSYDAGVARNKEMGSKHRAEKRNLIPALPVLR